MDPDFASRRRGAAICAARVVGRFNHANYGGYSTQQSLANFGQPTSVANVAYYPREAR